MLMERLPDIEDMPIVHLTGGADKTGGDCGAGEGEDSGSGVVVTESLCGEYIFYRIVLSKARDHLTFTVVYH